MEDPDSYSIPYESLKPTMNWTVEWAAEDDASFAGRTLETWIGSWEQIKQVGPECLAVAELSRTLSYISGKRSSSKTLGVEERSGRTQTRYSWADTPRSAWGLSLQLIENTRRTGGSTSKQQAIIAKMPGKEGFGFEQPVLPTSLSTLSPLPPAQAETSEETQDARVFTDSEDESG